MLKRSLITIMVMIFICGMGVPEDSPNVELRTVELIIKVRPETIVMPEGYYKTDINDIVINSENLKELNKRFNLISIERMFAKKIEKGDSEKEYAENEMEDIYLLRFPEHTDMKGLIEGYGSADEVIYAEENKTLEIF